MKVVLKACNFIKKRLQQRCFHVNISKVLGAAFYTELWHLLLKINFSIRKDFLLKKKEWKDCLCFNLFHIQIQEPTSRSPTTRAFAFLTTFTEFYYHKNI